MKASGRFGVIVFLCVMLGCEIKRGECEIWPGVTWQLLGPGKSRIVHHGKVVASGNVMLGVYPPYLLGYVSEHDGSSFYFDFPRDRIVRFTSELELPEALRAHARSRKFGGHDVLYCAESVMGPYGAMARDEFAEALSTLRDCLDNLKSERDFGDELDGGVKE